MAEDRTPDETPEQRRARRIAEARARLRGPGDVSSSAEGHLPPGARPAGETVEEVKATGAGPGGEVESLVEPAPAEETPEQKRARRIAEAKAKVKAGAAPAAVEPAASRPAPVKKTSARVETVDASDDPLVRRLRERFGPGILSAVSMLGRPVVTIEKGVHTDLLAFLRDDAEARFDLLLDVTAVHRPEETPPFELVYQLVSIPTGRRLRVKLGLADGEAVGTASSVWPTANWLERECYDMFGIVFEGHPDLRRILLPGGWEGHPLRKEYPVEFRENAWTRDNLNIVPVPADADFTGKFEA